MKKMLFGRHSKSISLLSMVFSELKEEKQLLHQNYIPNQKGEIIILLVFFGTTNFIMVKSNYFSNL